ncbi:MAG: hypothetical protein K9W44_14535 [Candidatus Lokiarchaeota archaeon]|nr:hypothetical protein [Candidatus Harpocratesius repetitus]
MSIFLEGDFIELIDGSFFEVKGFQHPKGAVVALPRYIPQIKIKNIDKTKIKKLFYPKFRIINSNFFYKLKSLAAKFEILQLLYPHIPLSHQNRDFLIPQVSYSLIRKHYRPESMALNDFRINSKEFTSEEINQLINEKNINSKKNAKSNDVLKDAIDFIHELCENTGLNQNHFGVTGSCLIGMNDEDSDIDLIIYGFDAGLRVRNYLSNLFREEKDKYNSRLRGYSIKELEKLYDLRVPAHHIPFHSFVHIELRKLHQGFFRNREFFIRYFEFENRESYAKINQFESQKIQTFGIIEVQAQVIGDEYWWITPCKVELGNVRIIHPPNINSKKQQILDNFGIKLENIQQVFTLRGRFTENVRLLEKVRIRGNLELVIGSFPSTHVFLQIVVGNNAKDLLIPI